MSEPCEGRTNDKWRTVWECTLEGGHPGLCRDGTIQWEGPGVGVCGVCGGAGSDCRPDPKHPGYWICSRGPVGPPLVVRAELESEVEVLNPEVLRGAGVLFIPPEMEWDREAMASWSPILTVPTEEEPRSQPLDAYQWAGAEHCGPLPEWMLGFGPDGDRPNINPDFDSLTIHVPGTQTVFSLLPGEWVVRFADGRIERMGHGKREEVYRPTAAGSK